MNLPPELCPERMVEPPIVDARYLTDCCACGHVSFSNEAMKADYVRPCPKCRSYLTVTFDRITDEPVHTLGFLKEKFLNEEKFPE